MPVAPSITWLLVRTSPDEVTTMPVPAAVAPSNASVDVTSTIAGSTWVAISEGLSWCCATGRAGEDDREEGPMFDATTIPIPRAATSMTKAATLPTVRRPRRRRRRVCSGGDGGPYSAVPPVSNPPQPGAVAGGTRFGSSSQVLMSMPLQNDAAGGFGSGRRVGPDNRRAG